MALYQEQVGIRVLTPKDRKVPKPAPIPPTAQFLGGLLKSAPDIMRKDKGAGGKAEGKRPSAEAR
jgi:hypothetical protein